MTKEERQEYNRIYQQENREKINATRQRYYRLHVEAERSRSLKYYRENPAQVKLKGQQYRQKKPKQYLVSHLRRKYNLSIADYNRLLESQNHLCATPGCGSSTRLCVDHDHTTGRIRGILCHKCNLAAGHMGDSPARLRALADYLEAAQDF
jgi:hypothetical protein